jgi:hypothetical protein
MYSTQAHSHHEQNKIQTVTVNLTQCDCLYPCPFHIIFFIPWADHRDNWPTYLSARRPCRKRTTGKTALAVGHYCRERPTAKNRTPEVALMNCWLSHEPTPPPTPNNNTRRTEVWHQTYYIRWLEDRRMTVRQRKRQKDLMWQSLYNITVWYKEIAKKKGWLDD